MKRIIAENISKKYQLGAYYARRSLREAIVDLSRSPFKIIRGLYSDPTKSGKKKQFWALEDISFEVNEGEIFGILGHNGAGKSTLLKILSRITEPTTGRAKIFGRIGSLLEVGTGFHSELTGRENIFLNGAILGMKRSEIIRKFDEIVAFSEVGEFLDTPVKKYSSGMYVRLAFSVAAHLEPEILLVDEVLAVGDAAFQQKCLGKMNEVAHSGRTILFVSHNLGAIQYLCNKAILLRNGRLVKYGTVKETMTEYLNILEKVSSNDLISRTDRSGNGNLRLTRITINIPDHANLPVLMTGKPAQFSFTFQGSVSNGTQCSFTIYDQLGEPVTYFDTSVFSSKDITRTNDFNQFTCEVDELLLVPGSYRINAAIFNNDILEDHVEAAAYFDVEEGDLKGRLIRRDSSSANMIMPHRWIKER